MSESSPIIIIGAPRSGTNMLRNVLCRLDGVETWPCDEINYIWRHGNRSYPNDQFPKELATDKTKQYITREFKKLQTKTGCRRVVEKTCASSLRVEFINEIFPTAQFIYIVRDGEDVAVSASLKRKAGLDIPYLLAKARYVPKGDIPYYAQKFLASRIAKNYSSEKSLSAWGPVVKARLPSTVVESAITLSAHQWVECVQASSTALKELGTDRFIKIHYETFVKHPEDETRKILNFLGENVPGNIENVVSNVRAGSVGIGRKHLPENGIGSLESLMRGVMHANGYRWG